MIGELEDAAFAAMRAPDSIPRIMSRVQSGIGRGERLGCDSGVTIELRNGQHRPARSPSPDRPSPTLEVGRVIRDRYVIEECLGRGGQGAVYKALDRYRCGLSSSPSHVAIKVLHRPPDSARDQFASLQTELHYAQMLAHQNIVKLFDIDRDGDLDFLTMELLQGELLSGVLARFHPHPVARPHAWSIIGQMAAGIAHAHERGVVHGDLKPQNVMITSAGEIRILDFGASRIASGDVPKETGRVTASITPAYACCELLDGRSPDPRDDLYGLACIAYELLSGEHPFQRRRADMARDFGIIAVRPAGLTRRQWGALAKGLSWHRAGRSIPVAKWVKRLKPRKREAPQVTEIREWKSIAPTARRPPSFRASAVFVLLIATIGAWMLFVRVAPGGKVRGETLPTLANGHLRGSVILPHSAAATPIPPTTLNLPRAIGNEGANAVSITPSDYSVQPGQHFAEIRVHRPPSAHGNSSFVWWTEAASAQPGVDYVSQAKVMQSFPKGQDSTSFFVKLLPRTSRSKPEVFYIAVSDKSPRNVDHVTHTTVRLPSIRNIS